AVVVQIGIQHIDCEHSSAENIACARTTASKVFTTQKVAARKRDRPITVVRATAAQHITDDDTFPHVQRIAAVINTAAQFAAAAVAVSRIIRNRDKAQVSRTTY